MCVYLTKFKGEADEIIYFTDNKKEVTKLK
jgi:hypothetical protein